MAPFPPLMLKEIKDFHPGLTDERLHEYTTLVYRLLDVSRRNEPEELDSAMKERDEFVQKYLPHLEEAQKSYERKVEERFRQMTAGDPVDIAMSSPFVIRWMAKNMKGLQYTTKSYPTDEPSRFIVEFESAAGPELHVMADIYSHDVAIVFQRVKIG